MELEKQIELRQNPKAYNYLKQNSYYIKELNRGSIEPKKFMDDMKALYKERTTDKLESLVDNMELISSVLNILK